MSRMYPAGKHKCQRVTNKLPCENEAEYVLYYEYKTGMPEEFDEGTSRSCEYHMRLLMIAAEYGGYLPRWEKIKYDN